MAERLQKVLAAAGVASRREAEAWITAGRVTVNGRVAELGLRVDEDATIAVDGRRLRLEKAAPETLVLIYHRSPGETLKGATPGVDVEGDITETILERLPRVRGRRWLPLSPLAPTDGGLEVFTTDGALRAAASRLAATIPSTYAVRLNGEPTEDFIESLTAQAAVADPPFDIEAVRSSGGEGRNRWYEFDVRRARGRDLRGLLSSLGFEVSRILRTKYGPVTMDRAVSRGRHRELTPSERDTLYGALGLGPVSKPKAPAAKRPGPGTRDAGPTRPRRRGRAGRDRSE